MKDQAPQRLLQDAAQDPSLCAELSAFSQQCEAVPYDLQAGLARFEAAAAALPIAGTAAGTAASGNTLGTSVGTSVGTSTATSGAAAGSAAAGAAKTAALLTGIKGAVLALGGLASAGAIGWALWPEPAAQTDPTVHAPSAQVVAEREAAPKEEAAPATLTPPQDSPNPLKAELALVKAVRRALAESRPKQALSLLQGAQSRFRSGALIQEREALTVIALFKSGQRQPARKQARRFLAKHPDSPLSPRIRRMLKGAKR